MPFVSSIYTVNYNELTFDCVVTKVKKGNTFFRLSVLLKSLTRESISRFLVRRSVSSYVLFSRPCPAVPFSLRLSKSKFSSHISYRLRFWASREDERVPFLDAFQGVDSHKLVTLHFGKCHFCTHRWQRLPRALQVSSIGSCWLSR